MNLLHAAVLWVSHQQKDSSLESSVQALRNIILLIGEYCYFHHYDFIFCIISFHLILCFVIVSHLVPDVLGKNCSLMANGKLLCLKKDAENLRSASKMSDYHHHSILFHY